MKKILIIILFTVIVIPTLVPLFNSNFFILHDNTQVERVYEMKNSLSDGIFPVRWVEHLGYGYGYPIFNFYAPLPYYIAGLINLVINNSIASTQVMFLIGTILSFIAMYLFSSRLTNFYGGLVAGVIYLYFPYHALNIYVRGAVGEFFAYAFAPLVFLGIHILYEKVKKRSEIPLFFALIWSLPLFLLIISHNLSAYMLMFFLLPYMLYLIFKSKNRKILIFTYFVIFLMSFVLSSFYILPAILESSYTNVESQVGGGAAYYDHFVCLSQYFNSNWGYGGSAPGCVDGISFALGKLNILIGIISLVYFSYLFIKTRKFSYGLFFGIFFIFSVFLTLSTSKIIWDNFPYMDYLQFPWRFLNYIGFFISIIAALLIYKLNGKMLYLACIVVTSVTIYVNIKFFVPESYINENNQYYESIEHISSKTSKISDEYMPKNFDKSLIDKESKSTALEALNTQMSLITINERTGYLEFYKEGDSGKIKINKAYFPSWNVYIDGQKANISEESYGMSVTLPEGKNSVVVKFQNTLVQWIGNLLSLTGISIIIVVIIVKLKRNYE